MSEVARPMISPYLSTSPSFRISFIATLKPNGMASVAATEPEPFPLKSASTLSGSRHCPQDGAVHRVRGGHNTAFIQDMEAGFFADEDLDPPGVDALVE